MNGERLGVASAANLGMNICLDTTDCTASATKADDERHHNSVLFRMHRSRPFIAAVGMAGMMPNTPASRPDVEGIEARVKGVTFNPETDRWPLFDKEQFIAHAVLDIPALIAWIEVLEEREKERNRPSDLRGTVG